MWEEKGGGKLQQSVQEIWLLAQLESLEIVPHIVNDPWLGKEVSKAAA